MLVKEIKALIRKANRRNLIPAVRLNGTSDVLWERQPVVINGLKIADNIMTLFQGTVFYDYTKAPFSKRPTESLPSNYDLTFSRSESNESEVLRNLENGRRVAVVFSSKPTDSIPEFYNAAAMGAYRINNVLLGTKPLNINEYFRNRDMALDQVEVIDGDISDLRFLDPAGVVVHLYAKGKARKDTTGFVVQR